MSYIGALPNLNSLRKLDALTFNGSSTTFNLTSSGIAVEPGLASALIISLNGVIQEPNVSYTVSGTQITFSAAPAVTDSFFGVVVGNAITVPNALPLTGGLMEGDITFSGTQTFPGTLNTGDIGTTVQAYDADLTAWAGKTAPTGDAVGTTDTQTLSNKTINIANNTLTGVQPTLVSGTSIKTVGGQSLLGSGDVAVGTGDVTLTGTQTLTNKTLVAPVNLASATATQDGVIVTGRAGGTSSYRVTLQPATLTGNRTLTLPDVNGNVVTSPGIDADLSRFMFRDCGWGFFDNGGTNAINFVNGSHQRWAPNTGAQTLSITNWPPGGNLGELLIEGVNLGAATITWPTVNWINPDGTTTTAISTYLGNISRSLKTSGTDFVFLWTRDAGTTIYGKLI